MLPHTLASIETTITRLGVLLEPNGDPAEVEGILNPASTRARDGKLLLYPRLVAEGNVSRIGLVEVSGPLETPICTRLGLVFEPQEPYELRSRPGGYGCEDPRVTYIPVLDAYVMAYTAFGPDGPRIAVAISQDAYTWERLGLLTFAPGLPCGDDKDGVFFPEPVYSPEGVLSIAVYHRPMLRVFASDIIAAVPLIIAKPPRDRECVRIGYIPLEPILQDRSNLLRVAESTIVIVPLETWGQIKNGAGTPPMRIEEGWLSLFHAVDAVWSADHAPDGRSSLEYRVGAVVHDSERPHILRYCSPMPIFAPQTLEELRGTVNNVVFPTGITERPDIGARTYDVYYGMADSRVGRVRLVVGSSVLAL
jgi:beta-1,2-mannobiose phosphorylase / 1,2-beta-oligomannan phosphorylase